mmetsp:Transcript_17446/g.24523  ORF Transcript_17446/g.24523 Transcript_17446/m.24523 type:complete len:1501 (+) Transcript_17446:228-4730(+)
MRPTPPPNPPPGNGIGGGIPPSGVPGGLKHPPNVAAAMEAKKREQGGVAPPMGAGGVTGMGPGVKNDVSEKPPRMAVPPTGPPNNAIPGSGAPMPPLGPSSVQKMGEPGPYPLTAPFGRGHPPPHRPPPNSNGAPASHAPGSVHAAPGGGPVVPPGVPSSFHGPRPPQAPGGNNPSVGPHPSVAGSGPPPPQKQPGVVERHLSGGPTPAPSQQQAQQGPPMHSGPSAMPPSASANRPPHPPQQKPTAGAPAPPNNPGAPRQPFARPGPGPSPKIGPQGPAGASAPPAPPPPGGIMRELRVEDALLYLDDVKREFGDRPRIYNEFLEIMKNFKSQEVDTPGVIERVSKLFRGYNNLILGFNKFLPDGYKIGLDDIHRAEMAHRRQEAAAAAAVAAEAKAKAKAKTQRGMGGPAQPPQQAQTSTSMQDGAAPPPASSMSNAAAPMGAPPARPTVQQQPQPFPPGPHPQSVNQPIPPSAVRDGTFVQSAGGQPRPAAQQHPSRQMPAHPVPPQPAAPQHQAVEFDHAISYVTNIKKRFANDPGTYHHFLEILHTYQKEQRGIKEVLEQVAELFADHPDLLKEFTFFLPDAVQEQAKERLHRAAEASEARQAAAMQQVEDPYAGRHMQQHSEFRPAAAQNHIPAQQQQQQQHVQTGKFIDMTRKNAIHQAEGQREVAPAAALPGKAVSARKRPYSPPTREVPLVPIHPPQPESFVYNSAVERQFFDAAKEALTSYTRDGGQAWAEFLKCLHLYSQEILSRNEMLNFVEPLLGKRNAELFEEFKRILSAAGSQSGAAPSIEDSWYSVPLSEIDFSRCRRCSPSYRALPRDYPAPPCSERNEEEAKVLNDVWVSLPVGSEESYTFRHMRRNQHEEVLFRCEDERFEIDMVIDSNAATLRRLEPIAEEIAQLAQEELGAPGGTGMGGKRYQYVFDHKRILGVIHRNSITRIYGDAGQEMLDLMIKNPTVAIPVVVQRLRQKDREWLAARERLNVHWKELAEMNYYKSLDNRSLTWRTTDKRATSTRTLVAEIKDRSANGGSEGSAALAARLDKAKEEHGSFYEVTMRDVLKRKLDLTNLPKPDKKLFTPHLSLMYENCSKMQGDAYRIIAFALERGSTSPSEKEKCHRVWREFLGPLFGLSLNWMQKPALDFKETASDDAAVISNGEEEKRRDDYDEESSSADENEIGNNVVTEQLREREEDAKDGGGKSHPTAMNHHPLPPGAVASTIHGEGTVVEFRTSDNTYVVDLPQGRSYLKPEAVLCSVLTVEKSGFTNQLRASDSQTLERSTDMLTIGTQSLYLFFRLHQILIRRLNIAKKLAFSVCNDRSLTTLVEQMVGDDEKDLGQKRYEAYLSLVYALIDGGYSSSGSSAAEGGKYEDRVRCLLGHGAYELATMDKLLSHIVKNLQNIASDDTMQSLIQLFRRHLDAGSFKPEAFRQEAAYLSEGDNMFAFQYCKVPETEKSVIHMEFLGVISDSDDDVSDELASDKKDGDAVTNDSIATKRQRRG